MRRIAVFALALLIAAPALAQQATQPAQPAPSAQQPPRAPRPTPAQYWAALLQGNQQYVAGKLTYDNLKEERKLLVAHQFPPITVVSCSDSRVPPELVFNQSLGTLFVVRTAGNVVDEFGVASLEFAILNGYTRLIVILGHEGCGAVKASLGGADPNTPALTALAKRIRSSFVGIPYDSTDPANLQRAVEANARASGAQLLGFSKIIRDAVLTEQAALVIGNYDLDTGEVTELK